MSAHRKHLDNAKRGKPSGEELRSAGMDFPDESQPHATESPLKGLQPGRYLGGRVTTDERPLRGNDGP